MIKVSTWDTWKLSWRNPVSPSRVQNLVTQLSDPPAMRSIGLPLMYRAGLSLVCVQVRHSEYHCDILGLIWLVVHSVPNSQTTRRSHFPPTPSSVYWAAGWRYMKAVHVEEAATWIWLKYDTRFLQFERYCCIYYLDYRMFFISTPSSFRLKQTVSSCRAGMETWGFSLQWLPLNVKSATFPQRLTPETDRDRPWTANHQHTECRS